MTRRVVIAEDEAIIRLDLKEILLDEGYDVVGETGRGDEAVDLVRDHHPDLVILDVKMPGSDGLAAARAIRDLELKVAVLILTAFSQRNLIDEARDAGWPPTWSSRSSASSSSRPSTRPWPGASRSGPSTPKPGRRPPRAAPGRRSAPRTSSRPAGWSTGPRAC